MPLLRCRVRCISGRLRILSGVGFVFFFFNDTATTEIYTLSLHDALPICSPSRPVPRACPARSRICRAPRSEEHTSELQSLRHLVCRLLLEKKKQAALCLTRSPSSS